MQTKPKTPALFAVATLMTFVAVLLGGATAPAQAGPPEDAVLDWNLYAVQALINASATAVPPGDPPGAGQTPPVAILHLAMVQGAVYDAVNMITGGYEPYLDDLPSAPKSASQAAAVATAAHDVLVGVTLVPPLSQEIVDRLHGLRNESIAAARAKDGRRAVVAGIKAGRAAAKAMLEERKDDGRYVPFSFTVGDDPGEWRPTPPANLNDPFAWVARVDPFLLESRSQFRTKGPFELTSSQYTKEYNEVKSLGGNGTTTPTSRTAEQTALARFYTVNPLELYNRAFRTIATGEGLPLAQEARLFATLNLAAADGLIGCWVDKARWSFWRPFTAIRLAEADGNNDTAGDPGWTPLSANPPYPDHPSGYNCVTGAFMHSAKAFFGKDRMTFSLTANIGTPPAPVTRSYERFTGVIGDTINARIYQGIHFRAPDAQGAGLGKRVARWADKNYFNRVKK